MPLPRTDLHRIHTWARGRVPEHLWPDLKVEVDISARYVDIVEVRPPWDGVGEHTRFPIARLRYTKATGQWAIYWRDRQRYGYRHRTDQGRRSHRRAGVARCSLHVPLEEATSSMLRCASTSLRTATRSTQVSRLLSVNSMAVMLPLSRS